MAAITPSYTIVNPSYIAPEMIIGYQQASGAFETIASGNPQVRLGVGDQYVYMRRLDIRTQTTSSQSGNGNQLPSVALDAKMISTPTWARLSWSTTVPNRYLPNSGKSMA